MSGKARTLRCLVADGADETFRQLLQVPFGTDDLPNIEFAVTDSGGPGNAVDVRLIDLRVRSGSLPATPEPDAEPIPVASEPVVSRKWLLIVQIAGSLVVVTFLGLGVWLWLLRRREEAAVPVRRNKRDDQR